MSRAGKHFSGKTRKGSRWLRIALIEASHAAVRSKGTYFSAQYARLKGRRGPKRATVAVGHSILVTAYHVLLRGQSYRDLGADYFLTREDHELHTKRLVRQLERLGHTVTLHPVAESV